MYRYIRYSEILLKYSVENVPYFLKSLSTAIALLMFIPQVSWGVRRGGVTPPIIEWEVEGVKETSSLTSTYTSTYTSYSLTPHATTEGTPATQWLLPTPSTNKEGKNKLEERLKDPNYWLNLCNLQSDTGKFEEAKAACEEVIALRPKNPLAWANHSGVLLKMEKYPEAIASAEQALKFDKKTSLALTYKCMAFSALGRNEEALDACNQALKVDGNWGRKSPKLAWINRGAILSTLGQYEKAIIAFDRTLLLEPRDSLAR